MTTPPTPESVLRDAFQSLDWAEFWDDRDIGDGITEATFDLPRFTTAILAASPTLASAIALGLAWQRASAAAESLGYFMGTLQNEAYRGIPERWMAQAYEGPEADANYRRFVAKSAPTPEAALIALAEALEARRG